MMEAVPYEAAGYTLASSQQSRSLSASAAAGTATARVVPASCSTEAASIAAMAGYAQASVADPPLARQGRMRGQSGAGEQGESSSSSSAPSSSSRKSAVANDARDEEASCSYTTARRSSINARTSAGSDDCFHLNTSRAPRMPEAHARSRSNGKQRANGRHAEQDADTESSRQPRGAQWYRGMRDRLSAGSYWNEHKEKVVRSPYDYLADKPGKEVRGHLVEAMNAWLQVPHNTLQTIHKSVAMLHTASLLIDDIEDASDLRRGFPASHCIYGTPQTLNSANYMYFQVYSMVLALDKDNARPNPALLIHSLNEEALNLHRGQGMDLYWRDAFVCPTEEEYIGMVNNKTSGLLRIIVRLMAGMSPVCDGPDADFSEDDFLPLINLIGLLFQIRDDYMNLRSGDYASNKGYCEDLHEGKFSFPVIHALSHGLEEEDEQAARSGANTPDSDMKTPDEIDLHQPIQDRAGLLRVLRARPRDADVKRMAVEYMDKVTGSFRYTCEVMLSLDKLVRKEAANVEAKVAAAARRRKRSKIEANGIHGHVNGHAHEAGCDGNNDDEEEVHSNERLWAILSALRKGWYGGVDCPEVLSKRRCA